MTTRKRASLAKSVPKEFFGLVTVHELNKVVANIDAQIAAVNTAIKVVNNTIVNIQTSFKQNDLLTRVQKLEAQISPAKSK